MIKTCRQCGAVNGDSAEYCSSCDASLGKSGRDAVARRLATPTEGNLAVEPEWRREVSSRLRDYRERRHGPAITGLQTALPFEQDTAVPVKGAEVLEAPGQVPEHVPEQAPPARARASRKQPAERYEIAIPLHEKRAAGLPDDRPSHGLPRNESAESAVFPVAPLHERRWAALLDGLLLLFSYGGMLALFTVLGGHIGFNKLDAVVTGATLVLFYAQYFALFTLFGGPTPGMMLRGLRVVSFDGSVPGSGQMARRSFGYVISAGTCFLGFLWALWDEDELTWHDRISRTYLTAAEGFAYPAPNSFDHSHR